MQMLRTIVWVIIAAVVVAFSMANWKPVDVVVWPKMILETYLPLPVISAFLLGSIPLWLMYRTTQWRLTRRVESAERSAAELRDQNRALANAPVAPVVPVTEPRV